MERRRELEAKIEVLDYLIGVASKTIGAEVWRSLFAEIRSNLEAEIKAL